MHRLARWVEAEGPARRSGSGRSRDSRRSASRQTFQIDQTCQTASVELDGAEARVVVAVSGNVEDVILDPDYHLLIWRPEYGARPTVAE